MNIFYTSSEIHYLNTKYLTVDKSGDYISLIRETVE